MSIQKQYTDGVLATARPLLPALRVMVRFPSRPTKVVSFECGVELSDLERWLKRHGRPSKQGLRALEIACDGAIRGNRKHARLGTPLGGLAVPAAVREVGGFGGYAAANAARARRGLR